MKPALAAGLAALLTASVLVLASGTGSGPERAAPMPRAAALAVSLDNPPVAERRPAVLVDHGVRREDPWFWLKDRDDPAVRAYLEAENAYAAAVLAALQPRVETIAAELRGLTGEAETTAPVPKGPHLYETVYAAGAEYPRIVRRPRSAPDSAPETVFDIAAMAAGVPFYLFSAFAPDPAGARIAYAVDLSGDRRHDIRVRDMETGRDLEDRITGASEEIVWAADGSGFWYVAMEETTFRPWRVFFHRLGTAQSEDRLVYEEKDDTFYLTLGRSASGRFAQILLIRTNETEVRIAPTADPAAEFVPVMAREDGHRYFVDHDGARFVILSNREAPDYRLVTAPEDAPGDAARWSAVLTHVPGRLIEGFAVVKGALAVHLREDARESVLLIRDGRAPAEIRLPDRFGAAAITPGGTFPDVVNADASSPKLRIGFSSPARPPAVFEHDVATGETILLRQDPLGARFPGGDYEVERILAPAPDGESVPVSLIYRRDQRRENGNPVLMLGYGAYGISTTLRFRAWALPLIDRGVVLALAHVRGGSDRGRGWYDGARVLAKPNSFSDFIAAAGALTEQGWAEPGRIAARGGSAGGLLVGAVMNMAPERFAAVVADVPFVDVVTTMLDDSIPLTTFEYAEWGDPRIAAEFHAMLAWSPYDQVRPQAYPALFVTAGFNDSQVSYHEPAKWVAKLRATATGDAPILFQTEMQAGHLGASGRFGWITQEAQIQAFLLDRLGVAQ